MVKQWNHKKSKQNETSSVSADILNFHFASLPPQQSSDVDAKKKFRKKKHGNQQYHRSEQDRSSARRKASSTMFYLHSSTDHAFMLTRISKQGYSYSGPDESVLWDTVRAVKFFAPTIMTQTETNLECCSICLDSFISARITKCGHCYCYPCLLRHLHTYIGSTTSAAKCPCCSLPIYIEDVRPVIIESVQLPKLQTKMKFVKLHRTKNCPSPYLPQHGQWKRSSPNAAPSTTDDDAVFSRFTYLDPNMYDELLKTNQNELDIYSRDLQKDSPSDITLFFISMSIERVKEDILKSLTERETELGLIDRFQQEHVGIYQKIPKFLFASFLMENQEKLGCSNLMQPHNSLNSDYEHCFSGEFFGSKSDQRSLNESAGFDNSTPINGKIEQASADQAEEPTNSIIHLSESLKKRRQQKTLRATLYLEDNASQFYQTSDGQLCFLSKFNMTCLNAEFSASATCCGLPYASHNRKLSPLPDVVEGTIIDIEKYYLTAELRKRMPFLSHIPLYTDISFIEIDLNHILSKETKQRFRAEFETRKSRRKKILTAEKQANRKSKKIEEQRINELKLQFKQIDPYDSFFQTVAKESDESMMTGEKFGPVIGNNTQTSSHHPKDLACSFRAVLDNTPSSVALNEESFPTLRHNDCNFPSLATISPSKQKQQPRWETGTKAKNNLSANIRASGNITPLSSTASSVRTGKKSRSKKVLLFSTGGSRGY
mmetsp:Transcript_13241/g.15169  ORF Transcript_13241/g.15169 Transcript_13241/m.15169 type:complete len:715 (-) Transcript_13241:118-2262(-)